MKRYVKTAVICIILCTAAVFCACTKEEEPSYLPEISYVSGSAELEEDFRDIIARYFNAVTKKDHMNVAMISTENFEMNYNETAFLDYSRRVDGFELGEIKMTQLLQKDDVYTVPVTCVLTINEDFTDASGQQQQAGEHEYCFLFSFRKTEDGYKLDAVEESAFG